MLRMPPKTMSAARLPHLPYKLCANNAPDLLMKHLTSPCVAQAISSVAARSRKLSPSTVSMGKWLHLFARLAALAAVCVEPHRTRPADSSPRRLGTTGGFNDTQEWGPMIRRRRGRSYDPPETEPAWSESDKPDAAADAGSDPAAAPERSGSPRFGPDLKFSPTGFFEAAESLSQPPRPPSQDELNEDTAPAGVIKAHAANEIAQINLEAATAVSRVDTSKRDTQKSIDRHAALGEEALSRATAEHARELRHMHDEFRIALHRFASGLLAQLDQRVSAHSAQLRAQNDEFEQLVRARIADLTSTASALTQQLQRATQDAKAQLTLDLRRRPRSCRDHRHHRCCTRHSRQRGRDTDPPSTERARGLTSLDPCA
jgi:hypothetical protein